MPINQPVNRQAKQQQLEARKKKTITWACDAGTRYRVPRRPKWCFEPGKQGRGQEGQQLDNLSVILLGASGETSRLHGRRLQQHCVRRIVRVPAACPPATLSSSPPLHIKLSPKPRSATSGQCSFSHPPAKGVTGTGAGVPAWVLLLLSTAVTAQFSARTARRGPVR